MHYSTTLNDNRNSNSSNSNKRNNHITTVPGVLVCVFYLTIFGPESLGPNNFLSLFHPPTTCHLLYIECIKYLCILPLCSSIFGLLHDNSSNSSFFFEIGKFLLRLFLHHPVYILPFDQKSCPQLKYFKTLHTA